MPSAISPVPLTSADRLTRAWVRALEQAKDLPVVEARRKARVQVAREASAFAAAIAGVADPSVARLLDSVSGTAWNARYGTVDGALTSAREARMRLAMLLAGNEPARA